MIVLAPKHSMFTNFSICMEIFPILYRLMKEYVKEYYEEFSFPLFYFYSQYFLTRAMPGTQASFKYKNTPVYMVTSINMPFCTYELNTIISIQIDH